MDSTLGSVFLGIIKYFLLIIYITKLLKTFCSSPLTVKATSQPLVAYLAEDTQCEWRGRISRDGSRDCSRHQLRLISKRCANNFFQRTDDNLKNKTIMCKGYRYKTQKEQRLFSKSKRRSRS